MPQRDEDRDRSPNSRAKLSEAHSGSAPSWDEHTYHGGAFGYGGWSEDFARSTAPDAAISPDGAESRTVRRCYRGIGPQGYKRSDERIKEDVSEELSDDPDVDASQIQVAVAAAEVTLAGVVPEPAMKAFAEQAASRAPGVRLVHNQLQLSTPRRERR